MSAQTDISKLPLASLPEIGKVLAEKLENQRFFQCLDLLFILPLHYEDRTRITPIQDIRIGKKIQIQGQIQSASVAFGRRRSLSCIISDASGSVVMRLYYFGQQQQKRLVKGATIRCYGEARLGKTGIELYHPKYTVLDQNKPTALPDNLLPVYPKIDGLGPVKLQRIIEKLLKLLQQHPLVDPVSSLYVDAISINEALLFVHNPPLDASVDLLEQKRHPMQLRLACEELVAQKLTILRLRKQYQTEQSFACQPTSNRLREQLLQSLSFEPTEDQLQVDREILKDMSTNTPMLRLLQGDVGSGKTLVAILAALRVIESGKQSALMAPTELLAEQHYQQCLLWLTPLGIDVAFIASSMPVAEKRYSLQRIASGQASMVIGTHAIIQKQVDFAKLVLVIIDEQHRFGVHQRLALRNKGIEGSSPHQLIMTATPIPRTLAMSMYADLDISVIHNLPPGRKPIDTKLINNNKREQLLQRVRLYCTQGQQVYWVCPLVEDSEKINCESAENTFDLLKEQLAELTIGLVHGRLDATTKQQTMNQFRQGKIQLLVATTVIEVGVDVPNASVMVIENAERLGLSQIHQLRGRIGRGSTKSYCILLYQEPLSAIAKERLKIAHQSQSGFEIAEKDLALRGPGELLGKKQSGLMTMKIADLQLHQDQMTLVNRIAQAIVENNESCSILLNRWFPNYEQYESA